MIVLIYSVILLSVMGIVAGLILAFASKKFSMWEDPKIKHIEESLPGANCGACGFSGCHAYAVAVAEGKAPPNLCNPGGPSVAEKIGKIAGATVEKKEPMIAQRYCNGGNMEAKGKFEYEGIKNCASASIINNGFKECGFSCLGLGDCVNVCPVDAIKMNLNHLPDIDKEKCIGCTKCVVTCPRNVLGMAPKKAMVHVKCSSKDPAKIVMKSCSVGCIACRICERNCPVDAIHVINNLAVIDYDKCINCGKCVTVCPRKIIIDETPAPSKKEEDEEKKEESETSPEEKKE